MSALADVPTFAQLPDEKRAQLEAVCTEVDVESGSTLVREGDFGYVMFAIVSGTAEVTSHGNVLRTLGPGDVFGEIAVLSSGRRTATVTATSPMRVVAVMNRDLWRTEADSPELTASLRQTIADCLASENPE